MPFKEVVAAGVYLVREALRSPNYVSGQQGWTINRDGSAEFQDVTTRGTIIVGGPPPGNSVVINASGGLAQIDFYSGGSLETNPGDIGARESNSPTANQPMLFVTSNEMGFDSIDMRMGAPTNAGEYGVYFINNSTSGTQGRFVIDGDFNVGLLNGTNLASLATQGAFQIGDSSTTNNVITSQEFQGRNNGVASDLIFQRQGGGVYFGPPTGISANTRIANNTIQAAINGVATTLSLNPFGGTTFIGSGGGLQVSFNSLFGGSISVGAGASVTGNVVASAVVQGATVQSTGGMNVLGGDINIQGNMNCQPPTAGATANCNLNSTGGFERIRKNTSSRRYKENIADLGGVTVEQILALRPRTFQRNDDRDPFTDEVLPVTADSPRYVGFIAEEADELGLTGWVVREDYTDPNTGEVTNRIDGFGYDLFVVAHQVVLQAQAAQIAALTARIEELEGNHNG